MVFMGVAFDRKVYDTWIKIRYDCEDFFVVCTYNLWKRNKNEGSFFVFLLKKVELKLLWLYCVYIYLLGGSNYCICNDKMIACSYKCVNHDV